MPRNLALVEEDGARGVEADGEEGRRHLARRPEERGGILPDGDGVQIDDAVDRRDALVLHLDPAAERAEVVSEREVARRLDAGKDAGLEGRLGHGSGVSGCEEEQGAHIAAGAAGVNRPARRETRVRPEGTEPAWLTGKPRRTS